MASHSSRCATKLARSSSFQQSARWCSRRAERSRRPRALRPVRPTQHQHVDHASAADLARRVRIPGGRPHPRVHRDGREPGHGVDLVDHHAPVGGVEGDHLEARDRPPLAGRRREEAGHAVVFEKLGHRDQVEHLGLVELVRAVGADFDPNLHQAMFEVPTTDHPPGTVVQVMQSGYAIGNRCLRPALVGVSKLPANDP